MSAMTATHIENPYAFALMDDPIMQLMSRGDILWGDLLCTEWPAGSLEALAAARPEPVPAEPEPEPEPEHSYEVSWDWWMSFPELKLRKDIWENFPVTCVPLGTGKDGAERHAIVWHRKNLAQWRQERSEDYDEWMNYEEYAEYRLFKSLRASNRWTVEDPQNSTQICVIRMNFEPKVTAEEPAAAPVRSGGGSAADAAAAPARPAPIVAPAPTAVPKPAEDGWTTVAVAPKKPSGVPVLLKLNDIKAFFPVVWHPVSGGGAGSAKPIYALEIFGKRLREMSAAAGRDLTKEVSANLMAALKASTAWRVLKGRDGEFCRLEMA